MPDKSDNGYTTRKFQGSRSNKSKILNNLLEKIILDLNADIVTFYTIDQKSNQPGLYKVLGLSDSFGIIEQTQSWKGLVWRVVQKRDIVTLTDIWSEASSLVRRRLFLRENIISYTGIPITSNGLILGVLEIFFRQKVQLDPNWYRLLRKSAQEIGSLLNSSRY